MQKILMLLFYCKHWEDSTPFIKFKLMYRDYASFPGWNDCILAESEQWGHQEKREKCY